MKLSSCRSWALASIAGAIAVSGCGAEPEDRSREAQAAEEAAPVAAHSRMVIRWGTAPDQVGFRPKAQEIAAEGPSSIAARGTSILVLDRLNERVMEIAPNGSTRIAQSVPRDAEHLAVGADGSIAAWSPLRASVWIHSRDGNPAGEIAIPRALRDVRSIAIGASRRIRAATTLQESIDLGSPSAPLDLGAALRTKREGAAFIADGRGVAVRAIDRAGELLVYGGRERNGKIAIAARHRIEGPLDAIQIAGAAGDVVCMRAERIATPSAAIEVSREAVCLNAITGATVLRAALPPPGQLTPHEELAVGSSPPVLVAMTPEDDGLLVQRWSLPAEVSR